MKICYIEPSMPISKEGLCVISETHKTGDKRSSEPIKKFVVDLILKLGNAVSSVDSSTCPVNTGDREEVAYTLHLDGKNVQRSWQENYRIAQSIIEKAVSKAKPGEVDMRMGWRLL